MLELTINNQVYAFRFGIGFLREINKQINVPVEGLPGVKKDVGFNYKFAGILNGDVEALIDVLDLANKGMEPRVTRKILDSYIEDEDTDIDAVFEEVLDFLKKANCTKNTVRKILEEIEKEDKKN